MIIGRGNMSTYECSKCGMSVNATCGKCNAPLANDNLQLDGGTQVQISKCPNNHGKIKSPLCCGQDMSCRTQLSCRALTFKGYFLRASIDSRQAFAAGIVVK